MVKNPAEITCAYCDISVKKTSYSTRQMCLLGFLAGAFISMAGFVYFIVTQDLGAYLGVGANKFFGASLFVTALVLIVFAGAELFTGNCLVVLGVFSKKIGMKDVFRNWTLIYLSNLVGAVFVGYLIYRSGLVTPEVGINALKSGTAKVNLSFEQAFLRGIFCNWLVCLAVWMSVAADDAFGKVVMMWFPVMTFVVSGFEHCIANMFYISFAIFVKSGSPEIVAAANIDAAMLANLNNYGFFVKNLLPVTIGNIVGAVVFVAIFYFTIYRKAVGEAHKI